MSERCFAAQSVLLLLSSWIDGRFSLDRKVILSDQGLRRLLSCPKVGTVKRTFDTAWILSTCISLLMSHSYTSLSACWQVYGPLGFLKLLIITWNIFLSVKSDNSWLTWNIFLSAKSDNSWLISKHCVLWYLLKQRN